MGTHMYAHQSRRRSANALRTTPRKLPEVAADATALSLEPLDGVAGRGACGRDVKG
jgi:hypothetical protein